FEDFADPIARLLGGHGIANLVLHFFQGLVLRLRRRRGLLFGRFVGVGRVGRLGFLRLRLVGGWGRRGGLGGGRLLDLRRLVLVGIRARQTHRRAVRTGCHGQPHGTACASGRLFAFFDRLRIFGRLLPSRLLGFGRRRLGRLGFAVGGG